MSIAPIPSNLPLIVPALTVNKPTEPVAASLTVETSPAIQVNLGTVDEASPVYRKPTTSPLASIQPPATQPVFTEATYLRYQAQKSPAAALVSQQLLDEWSLFRNDRGHNFRVSNFLNQVGALSAEVASFRNEARNFNVPAGIATEKYSPDFSTSVGKRRESFLLTIRTKEGDDITVRMTRREGPGGESLEFAFDVVGELSEAEQQALDKLASKLGEVADEFFRTGTAELRGLTAFDDAAIQSFKLELSKPKGDDYATLSYDYTFDETTQTRRLRGEDVAGYQFDITAHVNGALQLDRATAHQTIEQYLDLIRQAGGARGAESASVRFMLDGLRSVLLLDDWQAPALSPSSKTLPDELHTGLPDFTASFRSAVTYNPENRTQVSAMNLSMGQTTRTEKDEGRWLIQQESFYELHNSYFKSLPWLEAADFSGGNYVYVNEHESATTKRTLDMKAGEVVDVLVEREKTDSILETFFRHFNEIDRREDKHQDRQVESLLEKMSAAGSDEIRRQNLVALLRGSRFNLFD